MNLARIGRGAAALHQRGFALIAILALAAMIAAFLIAIGINRSSAELSNEREVRTMNALRQAKEALIAYAASDPPPAGYFQPGALPCPDKDDDDGSSDCTGSTGGSMIGRLPWRTLNIDNLRDSSGEELWYAVSQKFRKMVCTAPSTPANCTTINSDTQGQLSVTGAISMNNVVAVVLAPGPVVQGQTRPTAPTAAAHNLPANYVESFSAGDGQHFSFATNALPTDTLNDRLLVITQAEVMAAVEPIVAARIERDIVPNITSYMADWNAYPFPAPFIPPQTQAQYVGDNSLNRGLLPVSTTALRWRTPSITVTQVAGGTSAAGYPPNMPPPLISVDCGASSIAQISCTIVYPNGPMHSQDRPAIRLQAILEQAALSFPVALKFDDPKIFDINGDPLATTGVGQWSAVPPPQPLVSPPTVQNVVHSDGTGLVTFYGVLQNPDPPATGTGGQVTITVALPKYQPLTDASSNWFAENQWFRQTYYAVSLGFLPDAVPPNSCSTTLAPLCLTVNNLRPSYTSTNKNNKQAIIILSGSQLNGNSRPSSNTPDYFEGANLVASSSPWTSITFENRLGNPTSINDRVVVISPPPP